MQNGPFIPKAKTALEFALLQAVFIAGCLFLFRGADLDGAGLGLTNEVFHHDAGSILTTTLGVLYLCTIVFLFTPPLFLEVQLIRRYFFAQLTLAVVWSLWELVLSPLVSESLPASSALLPFTALLFLALFFHRFRASDRWRGFFTWFPVILGVAALRTNSHPLADVLLAVGVAWFAYALALYLPNRWGAWFALPLSTDLPPGPSRALIPSVLAVASIILNPYRGMKRLRKRYGDPFLIRLVPMGDVVITGRPKLVQTIFKLPTESFTVLKVPMLEFFFGKHCLFIVDGQEHYRSRRLLTPHFKADLMRGYAQIMATSTLKECSSYKENEPISMKNLVQNSTMDILMRVLFGMQDEDQIAHVKSIFESWNSSQSPLLGFRWLRDGKMGPHADFEKYNTLIRAVIGELIEKNRVEQAPNQNILSLLVRSTYEDGTPMANDHITDMMITLVVAGFDTTANTLSWAFELIHRKPDVLQKVIAELDALPKDAPPHELTKLPWLDAYSNEVLRHFPPIENLTVRVLKEPLQLGDYTIPAGTGVTGSAVLTNMNPDIYPDPEQFNPERFLGKKTSNHEMAAFGGGVRLCIGYALAHYQMRVALGTALTHFKFEPLGKGTKPKRYSVLVGPKNACPATISKRQKPG